MKYLPTVLPLALGMLLGCIVASFRGGESEPPSPAKLAPKTEAPARLDEVLVPVHAVALETSLGEYDPSASGDSELAQSRARALHLAKRCRGVPDEGVEDLFDELVVLDAGVDKRLALRILGARWAKINPQAASEAAAQLGPGQRPLVEHSMWQIWAQSDLIGFRAHMEDLRHELKSRPPLGVPFGDPSPWLKADPSQAMEAMLDEDWYYFREIYSMPQEAAPPTDAKPLREPPLENGRAWPGPPDMPPVLEAWFRSDLPTAMSWTSDALARESIPPRLRFNVVHHLNQTGFHAEAAELAEKHLTEDLQTIAFERILNRWQETDPKAAAAWADNRPAGVD